VPAAMADNYVNGDGLDDLIIGAHQSDLSGKLATGKS
jgi:hypothetical protein